MKVQCDVCQRAEATILCCADEAALCHTCDEEIHAANKLANKHQRVPLLQPSPSHIPTCDICQEKAGYFFCLEDRALLCRQCDVAVHTATPYVSAHQRFLVTGVRVALQQCTKDNACSSDGASSNRNSGNPSSSSVASEVSPSAAPVAAVRGVSLEEVAHVTEGFRSQWPWDDVFDGADFDSSGYGYSDFGGK